MKYLKVFGLFALTMFMYANAQANSAWQFETQEDLFSDSGKSAQIYTATERGREMLLLECKQKILSFVWLFKDRKTIEESSYLSVPVTMVVKVDNNAASKFSLLLTRRNDNYLAVELAKGYEDSADIMNIIKQIRGANSKVLMGLDNNRGVQQTTTFSVSGSTAASNQFIKACGLQNK